MTAPALRSIQQRLTTPIHDLNTYDQDVDDVAQSPVLDLPTRVTARIRWIHFILGAAVLLPWNAIITAMPYFLSRLLGSVFHSTFSSYLSTTFTVSGFCFLAHATAMSRQVNYSRHIRRSLLALIVLSAILAITTLIPLPPALFFVIILLNAFCQSSAGAYLQSAVIALASLFGPEAIQPAMSGQAAVGVLVSLIQVFSAGAGVHTSEVSGKSDVDGEAASAARAAFVFFGLSTLFLVFTIACHAWLVTLPAYKAVVVPFEAKKGVTGGDEEREALVGGAALVGGLPYKKNRIMDIAKMNAEYNFAVAYVFIVTLSVFPPITASIRSVHPPSSSALTHPLLFTAIHFLMFNVGDLIGRYLPMVPRLQFWSSRSHVIMALARTFFVPLFLLCNIQRPSSLTLTGGPVINSDIIFLLILLLFGISNGYVSSLVMMAAPSREYNPRMRDRPEDVDTAATIAQFCLVGGLAIGSFMSFGVRWTICACNPFTT